MAHWLMAYPLVPQLRGVSNGTLALAYQFAIARSSSRDKTASPLEDGLQPPIGWSREPFKLSEIYVGLILG